MNPESYRVRQRLFARTLSDEKFAAALVMGRRNLFYLAGTSQPCNFLVIPGHEPVLFARRIFDWVKREAAVTNIESGGDLPSLRDKLKACGVTSGPLGVELDTIPAKLYLKLQRTLPKFEIVDCSSLLLRQRMIKDSAELAALREASLLYEAVHDAVGRTLRPGITEAHLAGSIVGAIRAAGHDGLVFYRRWDAYLQPEGCIASGDALSQISGHAMTVTGVGMSPALPWGASRRTIEPNDPVVVDLGLNKGGYHADMSRTYVAGKASETIRAAFGAVLACQEAGIRAIRSGVTSDAVFDACYRVALAKGIGEYFQGYGAEKGEYVGHGVGLELDEPPVLEHGNNTRLATNMVLTVEPKAIGPFGAVQIEDTVIVGSEGAEIVGTTPRELFEVS